MQSLFQMAEKWLDVPFRWHGRDRKGCDCVGLIIGILYENHIMSDDYYRYLSTIKYGSNLSKIHYEKILDETKLFFRRTDLLETADLLLVEYKNSPIHFIVNERTFDKKKQGCIIHVTQDVGKVVKTNFDTQLDIVEKFFLL